MLPLNPPPSIMKLVSNDIQSDSTWKTWLNNLYLNVIELSNSGDENLGNLTLTGNAISSESTPVIQTDFIYNINPKVWELNLNNGIAGIDNHRLKLSTTAIANNSAAIFTKNHIKYLSGTSNTILFDAAFTTGVVGSNQLAGVGDISDGFAFGYSGDKFGLFLIARGHSEYQRLSITTASSTTENVTVTIDGVASSVPVTSSSNATITANEIAAFDYSNVGKGWRAIAVNNRVEFRSFRAENATGFFSISGSTVAGSFAEQLQGIAPDITFIDAAAFDTKIVLDPTLLNNYKINYQWGSGICDYYIQDPVTLEYVKVHTIKSVNNSLFPIINNPNLPLVYFAENTTNNTQINIFSTNISGYSDGSTNDNGVISVVSGVRTSSANNESTIMSIKSAPLFFNLPNRISTRIHSLSLTTENNSKPVTIRVYRSPTLVNSNFVQVNQNTPIMSDSSSTSFTLGEKIFGTTMGSTDSKSIFPEAILEINENESILITAESDQSTIVTVIFTFEDSI